MTRFTLPRIAAVLLALVTPACANYSEQLARAEEHYQNARYEAALTNLEDLEIHRAGLSRNERVRYDLVRGMSHLQLDQRQDARHWLALAREEAGSEAGALTEEARTNIERVLAQTDPLNPQPAGGPGASASGDGGAR
jgi:predicted alpha-1,6-mannanase (GH76 family)